MRGPVASLGMVRATRTLLWPCVWKRAAITVQAVVARNLRRVNIASLDLLLPAQRAGSFRKVRIRQGTVVRSGAFVPTARDECGPVDFCHWPIHLTFILSRLASPISLVPMSSFVAWCAQQCRS